MDHPTNLPLNMTSDQQSALQFLNTPVCAGDWTINIMLLHPTGEIGEELSALSKGVVSWSMNQSSVDQGPLYDSGSDYSDDEDEEDDDELEPEDHDDGQDLLSAMVDHDEEDMVDPDQDDEDHYELSLLHTIDGAVVKEMRKHNLTGFNRDEVPGSDVVVTINYSIPGGSSRMTVFQHVFLGHATVQVESGDSRTGSSSNTPLQVCTNIDVFRHEMYADPEMVDTTIASWIQEQHAEGSH